MMPYSGLKACDEALLIPRAVPGGLARPLPTCSRTRSRRRPSISGWIRTSWSTSCATAIPTCSATFWKRHQRRQRLISNGAPIFSRPKASSHPAAIPSRPPALFEPLLMVAEALGLFLLLTGHEGFLLLTFHEEDIREITDGDQPIQAACPTCFPTSSTFGRPRMAGR